MYTPSIRYASEVLVDFWGLYLLARLLADDLVAFLADFVKKAQEMLTDANDAERKAYRGRQIAQARFDHTDFRLDRVVREFELALLGAVNKDRSLDEYKRFFPKGLTAVIAAPIREELAAVRRIESLLAVATHVKGAAEWIASLAERRVATEAALADKEAAEEAHTKAMSAERTARSEWQRTYRTIFGELTRLFPQDRARVDSYFRPRPDGGVAETDPDVAELEEAPKL